MPSLYRTERTGRVSNNVRILYTTNLSRQFAQLDVPQDPKMEVERNAVLAYGHHETAPVFGLTDRGDYRTDEGR